MFDFCRKIFIESFPDCQNESESFVLYPKSEKNTTVIKCDSTKFYNFAILIN